MHVCIFESSQLEEGFVCRGLTEYQGPFTQGYGIHVRKSVILYTSSLWFLYILCLSLCIVFVKSIINLLTVQYCIANCVRWVPRLTLLNLMSKLGL